LSVSVSDWTLIEQRPGKRIFSGFDRVTGDLILMEEFDDQLALDQAAQQRDGIGGVKGENVRNLGVIPESVRARALREGWYFDDTAWKRWFNDSDNSRLRVVGGVA
jgi:hypothetical protein